MVSPNDHRGTDANPQERLAAGLILGNTLLTGRGVPCSGEGDTKNAIAMLIMDRLDAGESFTEFYAMDFVDQFLLMGHDGPFHLAIKDRNPAIARARTLSWQTWSWNLGGSTGQNRAGYNSWRHPDERR